MTMLEVSSALRKMWKKASEEEKKPFVEQYNQVKAKFNEYVRVNRNPQVKKKKALNDSTQKSAEQRKRVSNRLFNWNKSSCTYI